MERIISSISINQIISWRKGECIISRQNVLEKVDIVNCVGGQSGIVKTDCTGIDIKKCPMINVMMKNVIIKRIYITRDSSSRYGVLCSIYGDVRTTSSYTNTIGSVVVSRVDRVLVYPSLLVFVDIVVEFEIPLIGNPLVKVQFLIHIKFIICNYIGHIPFLPPFFMIVFSPHFIVSGKIECILEKFPCSMQISQYWHH